MISYNIFPSTGDDADTEAPLRSHGLKGKWELVYYSDWTNALKWPKIHVAKGPKGPRGDSGDSFKYFWKNTTPVVKKGEKGEKGFKGPRGERGEFFQLRTQSVKNSKLIWFLTKRTKNQQNRPNCLSYGNIIKIVWFQVNLAVSD